MSRNHGIPSQGTSQDYFHGGFCYFDSKRRLVLWCVQDFGHVMLFRVACLTWVTQEGGQERETPKVLVSTVSERELDPNAESQVGDRTDMSDWHFAWSARELLSDEILQYNRARFCDPTVGRWISEDPLGFEVSESDCFPYPSQ